MRDFDKNTGHLYYGYIYSDKQYNVIIIEHSVYVLLLFVTGEFQAYLSVLFQYTVGQSHEDFGQIIHNNQQNIDNITKKHYTTKQNHVYIYHIWGLCCQKQVSQARISNYIPQ